MKVTPIKTHKITHHDTDIGRVLDKYITVLSEKSVVVVTSKIVSICEGRIHKKISDEQKDTYIKEESEYYLPREFNQYGFMITINHNIMVASAGIDESNGNGYYVLWPKDPQKSANNIRSHLIKRYNLKNVGVIISDSKLTPLRRGVTGVSLVHSGFKSIYSYIGKPDIFGRQSGLTTDNLKIDDAVWDKITRPLGFDAGIRTLERTIEGIVRKVAYKIVSGQGTSFLINDSNLKEFLS